MSAKKGITNTLVWILMGLLIVGLGGFGVTNLNGNLDSIGRVGETEIELQSYARNLQNEISAEAAERQRPVTFPMAQELGIDQRVLGRAVQTAALEEETRLVGLSIGDANLRDQILDIPTFQGPDGSFDREAYRFTLERSNQTEAEFEENIREEAASTLLQAAVVAGVNVPDAYVDTLMAYIGERRTVTFAMLDRSALETGLPVPTEEDLIAYHQTHLPDFTTPAAKRITYAWLTPEMIIDTVEVDEESLRAAYDERLDEYVQPERRLVERLAFGSAEAAEEAKARVEAGEISFDALIEERGLSLADADMGDVSEADLGAAGASVFAAEAGDVVGPENTPIGPALFRVNAVLQAQETTFEEAEPELRDELAGDRARRVLDAQMDDKVDMLAGGATLEDLAKETDMELGTIDWHPGMTDGIAAYSAFRDAAETISEDDFPDIDKLDDEGLFAMRLDAVVEPQIQPLDEVRPRVTEAWRAQAIADTLREQVAPRLDALESGSDFADQGFSESTTTEITRSAFQPDAPAEFIETVFGLDEGEVTVIDGDSRIFVMRLDSIAPPDAENEEMARLRTALRDDAASGVAQDFFLLLTADIRSRAGVELDQQALNAVHSNFQ